jgi:hypothetical protein
MKRIYETELLELSGIPYIAAFNTSEIESPLIEQINMLRKGNWSPKDFGYIYDEMQKVDRENFVIISTGHRYRASRADKETLVCIFLSYEYEFMAFITEANVKTSSLWKKMCEPGRRILWEDDCAKGIHNSYCGFAIWTNRFQISYQYTSEKDPDYQKDVIKIMEYWIGEANGNHIKHQKDYFRRSSGADYSEFDYYEEDSGFSERDTFDAMTDGNMGSWDDFNGGLDDMKDKMGW